MKHIFSAFLFGLFLFSTNYLQAQDDTEFCDQTNALITLLKNEHLSPKPVNDTFSEAVFDIFLDRIDPYKRFLTKKDSSFLAQDRHLIDNYVTTGDCSFLNKYTSTLNEKIAAARTLLEQYRTKALDYTGKDTLYFSSKDFDEYLENEIAFNDYWSKGVRYKVLSTLIEKDSVIANTKKNFTTLEASVRTEIINKELCKLERLATEEELQLYVQEYFLNAIAAFHDPNSTFFNVSDKSSFENSLSTHSLSFGFYVEHNNNNDLVIVGIIPGSAAFFNENFEEDDIILKVASNGSELSTRCIDREKFDNFIFEPSHKEVLFTLKKKNGKTKEVLLEKSDKGEPTNVVTSYVLTGEKPVGYLQFSSFYTDFESPNGLGVANDVAKQLYTLKRSTIEGLIIDLRNNGGGSLKEAVDLCGMFIDKGPVTIFSASEDEVELYGDSKKGVLFAKPIIVLVNSFSASASELFAGVMQDYNRALIVGTTTYGKSSSQVILPLQENSSLGFSKVTTHQFFRVTGKSIQSQGIIPDISLPDIYESISQPESSLPFSLANTSMPVTMAHKPYPKIQFENIKANSLVRIKNNGMFNAIIDINHLLLNKVVKPNYQYPLTLDSVFNDETESISIWENYSTLQESYHSKITIKNTQQKEKLLQYDPEKKVTNTKLREDLQKDPILEETYLILSGLLTKNK